MGEKKKKEKGWLHLCYLEATFTTIPRAHSIKAGIQFGKEKNGKEEKRESSAELDL